VNYGTIKAIDQVPANLRIYADALNAGMKTLALPQSNALYDPYQQCDTWLGDINTVDNYGSVVFDESPITGYEYQIPISANDASYCWLKAVLLKDYDPKSTQSYDLFAYKEMYIKEGICAEGITCGSGGQLQINATRKCGLDTSQIQGSYQLNSSMVRYSTKSIVYNITASYMKMSEGAAIIKWRSYTPSTLLAPTFTEKWEIVGVLFSVLAIMMQTLVFLYYAHKYYKRGNNSYLYNALVQLLWLISNVLTISYLYVKYDSYTSFVVLRAFVKIVRIIATLGSCVHTAYNLNNVVMPPKRIQVSIYSLLLIIHLALGGSYYVDWITILTKSETVLLAMSDWNGLYTW
jgi:hypothetical protein